MLIPNKKERKRIVKYVSKLRNYMGLDNWKLQLHFSKESRDFGDMACSATWELYGEGRRGGITLYPVFWEHDSRVDQRAILVEELLHMAHSELYQIVEATLEPLESISLESQQVVLSAFRKVEEGVTNGLAGAIHHFLPLPPKHWYRG